MIKAISKIRAPFSTRELTAMDDMIEGLIEHVEKSSKYSSSHALQDFADDLTDMLVDIKVDLNNFKIQEQTNVQVSREGHNDSDINRDGTGQSSETSADEGTARRSQP
jgi:hypothetical protein